MKKLDFNLAVEIRGLWTLKKSNFYNILPPARPLFASVFKGNILTKKAIHFQDGFTRQNYIDFATVVKQVMCRHEKKARPRVA